MHYIDQNWVMAVLILQQFISIKCCSFEIYFHLNKILNKMYHSFHKKILKHFNISKYFLSRKSAY